MKRGFVDTPHGQIHYRTAGEGPTVIVLHGTPASSASFIPLIEALGKEMRAVGMDTIGYGDSDRPPYPYTTMSEFAQTLAWFIKGLGLEKARVFGTVTGSQIALQTAADFPEVIESLAVSECFNWSTPSRRAVHEALHSYHPPREDGGHLLEMWNHSRRSLSLEERERNFKQAFTVNDNTNAEVYGKMGWAGAGPYAMTRQDIWEVTPRVQAPTLVTYFTGSERHRALERFLATIPRSKGWRDAPNPNTDGEGTARMLIDYFKSPSL